MPNERAVRGMTNAARSTIGELRDTRTTETDSNRYRDGVLANTEFGRLERTIQDLRNEFDEYRAATTPFIAYAWWYGRIVGGAIDSETSRGLNLVQVVGGGGSFAEFKYTQSLAATSVVGIPNAVIGAFNMTPTGNNHSIGNESRNGFEVTKWDSGVRVDLGAGTHDFSVLVFAIPEEF
jgi:hypothetical protein